MPNNVHRDADDPLFSGPHAALQPPPNGGSGEQVQINGQISYAQVLREAIKDVEENHSTWTTLPEPAATRAAALRELARLVEEAESKYFTGYVTSDHSDWGKGADAVRAMRLFTAIRAGFPRPTATKEENR